MTIFPSKEIELNASGSFVDESCEIPQFSDQGKHPISKILTAGMESRQNILFFSPKVESILMITNGRVMACNVPHLGYDEDVDPDFKNPLLLRALGSQCLTAIPYFPARGSFRPIAFF